MILYEYFCPQCGIRFEAFQTVAERAACPCPECTAIAEQKLVPIRFDPSMGTDPDFPTAYAAWGKKHRRLGDGRMRDSNNTAYGTNLDIEKEQYNMRKRAES